MAGSEFVTPLIEESAVARSGGVGADVRRPDLPNQEGFESTALSISPFAAWSRRSLRAIATVDLFAAFSAVTVALLVHRNVLRSPDLASSGLLVLAVGAVWVALLVVSGGNSRALIGNAASQLGAVLRAGGILIAPPAIVAAWSGWLMPLYLAGLGAPVAVAVSAGGRLVAAARLRRHQAAGSELRRVVLVGDSSLVDPGSTVRPADLGLEVVGICACDTDVTDGSAPNLPVIRSVEDLPQFAQRMGCDAVMLSGTGKSTIDRLRPLVLTTGLDVLVGAGVVGLGSGRLHVVSRGVHSLLHVARPHLRPLQLILKRVFDLVSACLGLLVLSPMLLVVAILVKLDNPAAEVIFRQTRTGLRGRPFTMYKFRTMDPDAADRVAELFDLNEASGPLFKLSDDPRVTRIGRVLRRTSIDELPQLINVIRGSMSMVGPRPPLPDEVARYTASEHRRLDVVPGLTGLWQVSGRSLLSWEEAVRLDISYVDNWSLKLDLWILFRTGSAVLSQRGAF